jgi:hypothetical protein
VKGGIPVPSTAGIGVVKSDALSQTRSKRCFIRTPSYRLLRVSEIPHRWVNFDRSSN